MALLFKANGPTTKIAPADGRCFSLEEVHEYLGVGNAFQCIIRNPADAGVMLAASEMDPKKPLNIEASRQPLTDHDGPICGNAMLLTWDEFAGAE